jgi:hypothetical protein
MTAGNIGLRDYRAPSPEFVVAQTGFAPAGAAS